MKRERADEDQQAKQPAKKSRTDTQRGSLPWLQTAVAEYTLTSQTSVVKNSELRHLLPHFLASIARYMLLPLVIVC